MNVLTRTLKMLILSAMLTAAGGGLPGTAQAQMASRTAAGVAKAATTPVEDFGLKRDAIPPAIVAAVSSRYIPPRSCPEARALISGLDAILGFDIDYVDTEIDTMWEKGTRAASNLIVDAARDQVTGLIPFRGVVRKLSGAEANKKAMTKALEVGRARRSFLKGWISGGACP